MLVAVVAFASTALAATHAAAKPKTAAQIVPAQSLTINGDVVAPRTLKWSELAILPQQTLTVTIDGVSHVEQGPYLSDVLNLVSPNFLSCSKNDLLRWWVQVSSANGDAAVLGQGEINNGFGNRTAILAISQDGKFLSTTSGPRLVIPGEVDGTRDIQHVVMVTTRRATPELPESGCPSTPTLVNPTIGSLIVNGDVKSPQTFTFAQLQAMPQVTQTVSFLSGTTPTTNTETGPLLSSILGVVQPNVRAGCLDDKNRWYAEITGSDGYVSLLSVGEIDPSEGNRAPLVSLSESGVSLASTGPRVLQAGDVKGGRAVSGAVAITLFRVSPRIPSSGC